MDTQECPAINKRIKEIADYYTGGVISRFADTIKIKQQTINRLFVVDKRTGSYPTVTTEVLQSISEMYENINTLWLLTGKGSMFNDPQTIVSTCSKSFSAQEGIPLIPVSAMAGFGEGDTSVLEYECERYIIPVFKDAEFLIQVKGSSMYPKYSSGDIVACKKLPIDTFFQWNKVYVLDTEQGALIKRIKNSGKEDTLLIVSDNPNYEPFELHRRHIRSVAIVIGVVRVE